MIRGLMTNEEWAIFAPFLTTPSSRGGRPPKNHRHRLDGILWICRTGAPWRDLPGAFGKWNSVWESMTFCGVPKADRADGASGRGRFCHCFRRPGHRFVLAPHRRWFCRKYF